MLAGLAREGSGRERELTEGPRPPEGLVLKQKPYAKRWVERYAKIEGNGLFFFTGAGDTTPRGSSIPDVRRCEVRTLGMHHDQYLVTLERQGDEFLPDLQDDGRSRFCFKNESDRSDFAIALRNLAQGRPWDAPETPPSSPALRAATPLSPIAADALSLGSPSFEVERTTSPAGPQMEGWLEKWRRSKRFDISRSGEGHWQRLYFILDPKEKGLKYFKANPSQKNGTTWKELLFEHMEDTHVMWDTGQFAQGEDARELALQFRFDYRLSDKVYCLRAESTAMRDQWFKALESAVRRHHRRRAVRAITSGHLPDPSVDGASQFVPVTPKMDRFSLDDYQQWASDGAGDSGGVSYRSIRHLGDSEAEEPAADTEDGADDDQASGRPLRTGSAEPADGGATLARSQSVHLGSPGKKRFGKFRKKKSLSAANLEPVSQQLCANTRCLAPIRPRHRPGAHGQTPHQCHVCWKVYCGDCVRKRNLGGPGSATTGNGGVGPQGRVVVCDVCYWQYAQAPPIRTFSNERVSSSSGGSDSPLPRSMMLVATGTPPPDSPPGSPRQKLPWPGAEPEPEPEPEPEVPQVVTRERSRSQLQMEEFFIRFEEVTLGRPIDSGAFGTVYRGSYLGPVAVKAIPQRRSSRQQQQRQAAAAAEGVAAEPEQQTAALLSARMVEEIRAQTRFHHQNVVQFLGLACGKPPHSPCEEHWMVITELCDMNLYRLLHSARPLNWKLRLKLALDIAQGMTYLHDKQQLAHLDLKSPNVLLKGKDAKLADFGSLKRMGRGGGGGGGGGGDGDGGGSGSVAATMGTGDGTTATGAAGVGDDNVTVGGVGGTAETQAAALRRVKATEHAEAGGAVLRRMGVPARAAQIAAGSLHSGMSSGGSSRSSTGGHTPGTPEWMAPELLDAAHPSPPPPPAARGAAGDGGGGDSGGGVPAGAGGIDWKAADRYSFAMVLWELLTRKRPYEGYGGAAAVRAVGPTIVTLWAAEGQRPAFPSDEAGSLLAGSTPAPWARLCESCWAEAPADRPRFAEITRALREMHPGISSWPDPDGRTPLAPPPAAATAADAATTAAGPAATAGAASESDCT